MLLLLIKKNILIETNGPILNSIQTLLKTNNLILQEIKFYLDLREPWLPTYLKVMRRNSKPLESKETTILLFQIVPRIQECTQFKSSYKNVRYLTTLWISITKEFTTGHFSIIWLD